MKEPKDIAILIVDDEKDLRAAIVFDFQRKGFQVLEAENGKQAFEIVATQKVDIVISDVQMSGGNGIELLEKIKEHNYALPVVIFITGFADITLEDAYNKGVDAVFYKPFDRKDLLSAVLRLTADKFQSWSGRRTERVEASCDISFSFSNLEHALQGKVLTIGRGGFFVEMDANFPEINSEIQFKIQFEEGSPHIIQGSGVVRWTRTQKNEKYKTGCGVEFQYLDEVSRKEVINFINKIKTKSFIPIGHNI